MSHKLFACLLRSTVDYEGFVASKSEGYVAKFAPHQAIKLIA